MEYKKLYTTPDIVELYLDSVLVILVLTFWRNLDKVVLTLSGPIIVVHVLGVSFSHSTWFNRTEEVESTLQSYIKHF